MNSEWTRKEIEDILIQLNDRNYPFKHVKFSNLGQGMEIVGEGGSAIVYQSERGKKLKKDRVIKVIGFGDKKVDDETFFNSVSIQNKVSGSDFTTVYIHDYRELKIWLNDEYKIQDIEEVYDYDKEECEYEELKEELGIADTNVLTLQFIQMEKLSPIIYRNGNQYSLLPDRLAQFDQNEILKLAVNIGNVLVRTHNKNALHRDIKLENVFYDAKKNVYKLGDFGISKVTEGGIASTVAFTKGYGAPEVVLANKYDNTADIYSFGMMLYILFNKLKFPNSNSYHSDINTQYKKGYKLPPIQGVSDRINNMLAKMCSFNPGDRYQSMNEVMDEINNIINKVEEPKVSESNTNILKTLKTLNTVFFTWGVFLCILIIYGEDGVLGLNNPKDYIWVVVSIFYNSFCISAWIIELEEDNNPKGLFKNMVSYNIMMSVLCIIAGFLWKYVLRIYTANNNVQKSRILSNHYIYNFIIKFVSLEFNKIGFVTLVIWTGLLMLQRHSSRKE